MIMSVFCCFKTNHFNFRIETILGVRVRINVGSIFSLIKVKNGGDLDKGCGGKGGEM